MKTKDDHYADKIKELENDIEMARTEKDEGQIEKEVEFEEEKQHLLGQITLLEEKAKTAEADHRKAVKRMEEEWQGKVQDLEMMTETLQAEVTELNNELEHILDEQNDSGSASARKSARSPSARLSASTSSLLKDSSVDFFFGPREVINIFQEIKTIFFLCWWIFPLLKIESSSRIDIFRD